MSSNASANVNQASEAPPSHSSSSSVHGTSSPAPASIRKCREYDAEKHESTVITREGHPVVVLHGKRHFDDCGSPSYATAGVNCAKNSRCKCNACQARQNEA